MSICIVCGRKLGHNEIAYCKYHNGEGYYHKKYHHDVFGGIEKRDDWGHR